MLQGTKFKVEIHSKNRILSPQLSTQIRRNFSLIEFDFNRDYSNT